MITPGNSTRSVARSLDHWLRKSRSGCGKLWAPPAAALGLMMISVTVASASASPWMVQPTPPAGAGGSDSVAGVSCVSASHCVAVGPAAGSEDVSLGWNGTTWSQLPYPNGAGDLTSIACTSASYCIAVGETNAGLAGAWAWDGSTWTGQSAYNPRSTDNILNAISCRFATRCEAVGSHGNGGTTRPLAEVWNGSTWKGQSTSGAPPGSLAGVSCESASKCEAVGRNTYTLAVLAMGLSKSRWVTQATPSVGTGNVGESAVSCWSSGCTAVGGTNPAYTYNSQTIAESWNGSGWTLQGTVGTGNPPNSGAAWAAVRCQSATKCTAVGAWANGSVTETPSTLISTWDGTTWTQQSSPNPGSNGNMLAGIACTHAGSICEAVGWAPPNTLAMGNQP